MVAVTESHTSRSRKNFPAPLTQSSNSSVGLCQLSTFIQDLSLIACLCYTCCDVVRFLCDLKVYSLLVIFWLIVAKEFPLNRIFHKERVIWNHIWGPRNNRVLQYKLNKLELISINIELFFWLCFTYSCLTVGD